MDPDPLLVAIGDVAAFGDFAPLRLPSLEARAPRPRAAPPTRASPSWTLAPSPRTLPSTLPAPGCALPLCTDQLWRSIYAAMPPAAEGGPAAGGFRLRAHRKFQLSPVVGEVKALPLSAPKIYLQ